VGFQTLDLDTVRGAIHKILAEVYSPYNDGWTQSSCKHELYMLKCWLEDEYNRLPRLVDEEQWEAERVWNRLKLK
jgi:hypothetical protein